MTDPLDEAIEAAVQKAMQKPTFHEELTEAIFLCLESGLTLADILGESRRAAVQVARKISGSKTEAAKKLGIGRQTYRNIEQHYHKY